MEQNNKAVVEANPMLGDRDGSRFTLWQGPAVAFFPVCTGLLNHLTNPASLVLQIEISAANPRPVSLMFLGLCEAMKIIIR